MAIPQVSDGASINQVLADNLARLMSAKGLSQMALAGRAAMGQTTVSLYLNPGRRAAGKSGKEPSAKLAEVQRLADALGTELWQLLRPSSALSERGLDRASLSDLAADLGHAFDELPLDEVKVRLYAKLLNDIRTAMPLERTVEPSPSTPPIPSQSDGTRMARDRSLPETSRSNSR